MRVLAESSQFTCHKGGGHGGRGRGETKGKSYGKSCKEHVIYNAKGSSSKAEGGGRSSVWGAGPEVGSVFNVYERIKFALTKNSI